MYEVFINHHSLILSNSVAKSSYTQYDYNESFNWVDFIKNIPQNGALKLWVKSDDIESSWCSSKAEFELIIAAAQRAREISNGVQIEVDKDNDKNTVISLREIGDGAITYDDLKERYLKSLQKVVINNDEDEENDIEEEFSSYLKQDDNDKS